LVLIVVTLTQPQSVADDLVVKTDETSPREEIQRDHPGSMLPFVSGNAIKKIRTGVKARRSPSFDPLAGAFTLRLNQFQTKREYCFVWAAASTTHNIGRYK
jgi:hypothetical protein